MTPSEMQQHWSRWVILAIAVSLCGLELLDTTIVTVSLPYMRGGFSANTNQISWVMSAYLLGLAIVVPLTGFLIKVFGKKNLLFIAVSGFAVASILCASATNLPEMILFSLTLGLFGALLAPLGQSLLIECFSAKQLPRALSLFGIGVMGAPIFGPILGGILTQYLNWRWDYLINIPICIIAIVLIFFFVINDKSTSNKKPNVDWLGMGLLTLGLGSTQFILSEGTEQNWFQSSTIIFFTLIAAVSLVIFVVRGIIIKEKNIVNLMIYKNMNFTISSLLLITMRMTLTSTLAWTPNFLQNFLGFSPLDSAYSMVPFGLFSIISLLCVPFVMRTVKPIVLITTLFIVLAFGNAYLSHINLHVGQAYFMTAFMLLGACSGLFFVPLVGLSYSTLPEKYNDEASGLFNFARAIAGTLGVSITSTIITTQTQVNWNSLSGSISVFNPHTTNWLAAHHLSLKDPSTTVQIAHKLAQTAGLHAYSDAFYFSMVLCVISLPLVLFIRSKSKTAKIHS